MKDLFTISDIAGYSAASIITFVSLMATGVTAILGVAIAIVTLKIQLKRLKNEQGKVK